MVEQVIDIDKLIEQEAVRDAKRKEYNARPDVQEKRKVYNLKRQAETKVARDVMAGKVTREEGIAALAVMRGDTPPSTSDDTEESEE